MATWKKIITSGSALEGTTLTLSGLGGFGISEVTALTINASNAIGTRTLGSLAFSSATYDNYSSWTISDGTSPASDVAAGNTMTLTGTAPISTTESNKTVTIALATALTTVNSILATDLVLGEDAQTQINFESENEIHFDVGNTELLNLKGNIISGSAISTGSFGHLMVGGGNFTSASLAGTGTIDTSGTPADNDFAKFTDADTVEGRSYAEVKQDLNLEIGTDVLAQQTIGIADNNLVEIDDADAADNDFARFTTVGLEGRSYAEVKSDLDLEIGTDVLAQQTIGIANDNLLEVDDADAADNDFARFTAAGLEGRSYSEVKSDLNLEIGTDVLAQQTIGIANDNLVEIDDTDAADNDFAKFTAAGLEGRSYSEVRTDLSLGTAHTPQFTGLTLTGNAVVGGNLTVNGTTTTLATTNLLVKDAFVFVATGSAGSNVDGGIIVQSGSVKDQGTALYHDTTSQRWAVAKSINATATTVTPLQSVVTIDIAKSTSPDSTSGSFGVGEMWVDNNADIWIRTTS